MPAWRKKNSWANFVPPSRAPLPTPSPRRWEPPPWKRATPSGSREARVPNFLSAHGMEIRTPFIVLSMRTQCTFRWGIEMIRNARRWATSASICFVVLIFAGLQTADAQTKDFNVPAQSATTGIPEFARQAGIQILVSETLVRGKRTAAVTGALTVEKALRILLQGTGLTANSMDGATFTLSTSPPPTTSFNPPTPREDEAQKRE